MTQHYARAGEFKVNFRKQNQVLNTILLKFYEYFMKNNGRAHLCNQFLFVFNCLGTIKNFHAGVQVLRKTSSGQGS